MKLTTESVQWALQRLRSWRHSKRLIDAGLDKQDVERIEKIITALSGESIK